MVLEEISKLITKLEEMNDIDLCNFINNERIDEFTLDNIVSHKNLYQRFSKLLERIYDLYCEDKIKKRKFNKLIKRTRKLLIAEFFENLDYFLQ